MAHLPLSMLGELQITPDDVPISSLESDEAGALLACLAVEAGRPHPREILIGLCSSDYPKQDARHGLSQALFKLRTRHPEARGRTAPTNEGWRGAS